MQAEGVAAPTKPHAAAVGAAPIPGQFNGVAAHLATGHRVYQTMSQGTGHPWSEDVEESCVPYVVHLSGPNPCVRKVHMVLVTLLKLNGPVPRLMAREPRVQKAIRRISDGLHRCVLAGPGENADVPTLEGVGSGRLPPPCPLHVRQMGVYARVH